jgi:hypothetical protein
MKKFTTFFAVMVMVTLFAVSASAGPIDWVMDKLGYIPTAVYETQVQLTDKALAAAKVANAAAAEATVAANRIESIANYSGLGILLIGGLGYLRRKKIAHTILDEKKTAPVQRELNFGEKPPILST